MLTITTASYTYLYTVSRRLKWQNESYPFRFLLSFQLVEQVKNGCVNAFFWHITSTKKENPIFNLISIMLEHLSMNKIHISNTMNFSNHRNKLNTPACLRNMFKSYIKSLIINPVLKSVFYLETFLFFTFVRELNYSKEYYTRCDFLWTEEPFQRKNIGDFGQEHPKKCWHMEIMYLKCMLSGPLGDGHYVHRYRRGQRSNLAQFFFFSICNRYHLIYHSSMHVTNTGRTANLPLPGTTWFF